MAEVLKENLGHCCQRTYSAQYLRVKVVVGLPGMMVLDYRLALHRFAKSTINVLQNCLHFNRERSFSMWAS